MSPSTGRTAACPITDQSPVRAVHVIRPKSVSKGGKRSFAASVKAQFN